MLKIQLLLASALHDSQHLMYAKKFVVNLRNKLQIADNKSVSGVVLQKVASELHPKVRNHGEGPY